MDEGKDKELEKVNAIESIVTVNTVVITTTTTETVIKEVVSFSEVEGSEKRAVLSEKVAVEEDDLGDVMVEVLGSDVFVDGVVRGSGEVGSEEFGRQAINDGENGSRGVDEFTDTQDGILAGHEDDLRSYREESLTNQLRNQYVDGYGSSLGCDIDKDNTIETVVGDDVERKMGDAGVVENAELVDNRNELCRDSSSCIVEGKCDEIGKSVNEEESLNTVQSREDEVLNSVSEVLDTRLREQASQHEGGEQVVRESASYGCGTVLENETINGGQEKSVIFESVTGDTENINSKLLALHTQTYETQLVDGSNESIPVSETDEQINGIMIEERLQFIIDEKSNGTAGIGEIDEMKLHGTDMGIVSGSESLIQPENRPVDMKERGEDIETSVILADGMDIDAVDANFVNEAMVCDTFHDNLKSNCENQQSETVILAKCNSGIAIADDNTKSSVPIASTTMGKQCVVTEGKIHNIVENRSPVLNTENIQELQRDIHSEQVPMDYALPNEGDQADLWKPVTLEEPNKQVLILNASTNEETIKLSDTVIVSMDDVAEEGLNTESALVVHVSVDKSIVKDDHPKLSDYVTSEANAFTQNNSNAKDMEELAEETANEEFVYMNNVAPGEEETLQEHNLGGSANLNTQSVTHMVDENDIAGPFILETEDPEECVAECEYEDVVSSPIHDNERSDSPIELRLEQEETDNDDKVDSYMEDAQEEQDVDEGCVSGSSDTQNKEDENFDASPIAESLLKDHRVSYELPLEIKGEFSVSDLVWGKVKSHPWWPGQIFHPSDSSEKAMKYFRKDCYLVAYFGDRTFAWNEASVLKPFRNHFSVAERQHKTETFQNAVSCALEEVSRRTELGLACSCVSQEHYDKIRYQMVENTGIREEARERDGVDRCVGLDYFQPDKLVEYVRSIAVFPTSSVDRLELVIAKAQLFAFLRLKGIDTLADFQYYEGISGELEYQDSPTRVDSKTAMKGAKRKHNLKDIVYERRREKSMNELMGETMYYLDGEFDSHEEDDNLLTSPTSRMKRKASGFDDFTKTISVAKVSHTASSNTQQSFKVGDCIRRVASQLTGSPSILRGGDGADEVLEASNDSPTEMSPSPSQESSLDEMLSQLHLSAQDPMKGYSFLRDIVDFFTEFRNMAVSTQRQQMRKGRGRKPKASRPIGGGTPETFEFDDRNDSYWKDMVVQNNAEAKPARRSRKRKEEQVLSVDSEKPSQSKPRKSSRKQYFHGVLGSGVETPFGSEGQQSQLPTELMLNFTGMGSIPSEINLNKMFRCFGPLKESETEIDTQSNRARVVFKKRSDAEVAYSSAAMFNIFGSMLVNYQLNYTPSVSFKSPAIELTDVSFKTPAVELTDVSFKTPAVELTDGQEKAT